MPGGPEGEFTPDLLSQAQVLAWKTVRSHALPRWTWPDVHGDARLVIVTLWTQFEPDKSSWVHYADTFGPWRMADLIRARYGRNHPERHPIPMSMQMTSDDDDNEHLGLGFGALDPALEEVDDRLTLAALAVHLPAALEQMHGRSAAFVLHAIYWRGLTQEQVAEELGVTGSAVCQTHLRAINDLRSFYAGLPGEIADRLPPGWVPKPTLIVKRREANAAFRREPPDHCLSNMQRAELMSVLRTFIDSPAA